MDRVVESRPPALSFSRRDLRRSWSASVELSPACREKIRQWLRNLCRVNNQAIRPRPFPSRISHVFADASDKGSGAVISVEGPEASFHPSSGPCARWARRACPTTSSSSQPAAGSSS